MTDTPSLPRAGHQRLAGGGSSFCVFAPEKKAVAVLLPSSGQRFDLARDTLGYWHGQAPQSLPHGTLYWLEADGQRLPDPASRGQPHGVHGPSMVVDSRPAHSPGWRGVGMADAIIYELHLGTFTPEGTLAAAQARLPHLSDLGITVIELLPLAAFPGERNWGYDGTFQFALHAAYGSLADLTAFIEAAHALGMAVINDVVYNHFGPEGHYADALAPYTKRADTPWGAAINFDGAHNHGVRAFFLDNTRFWLEDVGFDGLRMDAVSLVFDLMPQHILRECTDLARSIGQAQRREVIMIAEHLRNNRFVTREDGFGYHAQWNDDLNHALFAHLTGETGRHYGNFGSFDDVVKALADGFVLDGTRLCHHYQYLLGTDGRLTQGQEHVVHMQNHDQVGNRPHGDRMVATHGRDKALLAITAVMASPFVPMLWMGEEYGETAPFLFFVDFSDPGLIEGVRRGRKADFGFAEHDNPPDPQDRATFLASKLQWDRAAAPEGQAVLSYYRDLIALKRSGALGPRDRRAVQVQGHARGNGPSDAQGNPQTGLVTLRTPQTLTVLNLSGSAQAFDAGPGWALLLASAPPAAPGVLAPYSAWVLAKS